MGQSASIVVDSAGVADLHGEPLAERARGLGCMKPKHTHKSTQ